MAVPAEWEPQSFVLLAWPHLEGDFAPWIEEVWACYLELVRAISERAPVLIAYRDEEHRAQIAASLGPLRKRPIFGIELPFRDTWVRDTAPVPVVEAGRPRLVKFRFNGWGGRYPHLEDDRFGRALWERGVFGGIPLLESGWVVEGGSLESDGRGGLLTTESALLNPNRNPEPEGLLEELGRLLGVERWFLLKGRAIPGDDTDGHVDLLARFVSPETVVHLEGLEEELKELLPGRRLVPLPLPDHSLPASYCNFLMVNGVLLLPQYGLPEDRIARRQLARALPEWEIVPLDASPLIRQSGSIHCATFNYPEPFLLNVERCSSFHSERGTERRPKPFSLNVGRCRKL